MATRIYKTPFAATGDKETLATADQPDGKVSLQAGWTPDYELPNDNPNYRPVGRLEMNGVLSEITQALGEVQLNGFSKWQAIDGGWPLGAWVSHNGTVYVSAIDNNTSEPGTAGAGWATGLMGGVVGDARNAKMAISGASTSATFTADEVVVGTLLGGQTYRLAGYSQSINLSTTGPGGMDTGLAPASGYVALYAIYNPSTGARSIIGVNATSAIQPEVYGGTNMPAGYTASALVSVWPTNASRQMVAGFQAARKVCIVSSGVLSTSTTQAAVTSLSIANAVPPNARSISGVMSVSSTSSTPNTSLLLYASGAGVGQQGINASLGAPGAITTIFNSLPIANSQTTFYTAASTAGTPTFTVSITSYDF